MDNSPYNYIVILTQKRESINFAVCASAFVANDEDANKNTDINKTTK